MPCAFPASDCVAVMRVASQLVPQLAAAMIHTEAAPPGSPGALHGLTRHVLTAPPYLTRKALLLNGLVLVSSMGSRLC